MTPQEVIDYIKMAANGTTPTMYIHKADHGLIPLPYHDSEAGELCGVYNANRLSWDEDAALENLEEA